jgi:hypothetical protein
VPRDPDRDTRDSSAPESFPGIVGKWSAQVAAPDLTDPSLVAFWLDVELEITEEDWISEGFAALDGWCSSSEEIVSDSGIEVASIAAMVFGDRTWAPREPDADENVDYLNINFIYLEGYPEPLTRVPLFMGGEVAAPASGGAPELQMVVTLTGVGFYSSPAFYQSEATFRR